MRRLVAGARTHGGALLIQGPPPGIGTSALVVEGVRAAGDALRVMRASGEGSAPRPPDSIDVLRPQKLQIVQPAAEGLSNRDIAERMYLSRRTVESHLYRVFPKLGVTGRSQLPRVLGDRVGPGAPGTSAVFLRLRAAGPGR